MSVAEKLTTIAENVPKVYKAGKEAEHKAFWDKVYPAGYDENEGMGYSPYRFAGYSWNDDNFFPTRNLKFKNSAMGLFRITGIKNLK